MNDIILITSNIYIYIYIYICIFICIYNLDKEQSLTFCFSLHFPWNIDPDCHLNWRSILVEHSRLSYKQGFVKILLIFYLSFVLFCKYNGGHKNLF